VIPPLLAAGGAYEPIRLSYPAGVRFYVPDATLPNGIAIEVKGRFLPADRAKLLAVRDAHPLLDLRLVFDNATRTLSKVSKTSYGDWCRQHGFPYATKVVPPAWITEPRNEASLACITTAPKRKVK
jgi:hypothetical protein